MLTVTAPPLSVLVVGDHGPSLARLGALLTGAGETLLVVASAVRTSRDLASALTDPDREHDAFLVVAGPDARGGLRLAREILARDPHAPVILVTDGADEATDAQAAVAGVAEHLDGAALDPLGLARALRFAVTSRRALAALAESEERHRLALEGTDDGLWDWDLATDVLFLSPRWKAILGQSDEEVENRPESWLSRIHPDDRAGVEQALAAHRAGATRHFAAEHRLRSRDGSYRWCLARGVARRGADGAATRIAGTLTDVTSTREAQARLERDALHDPLTGLPNRALFLDRLALALRRAARRPAGEPPAAVLFLDLDRFKTVNDSLGHLVGDRLLVAAATRLRAVVRPADTVARLGGDEFVVLLEGLSDLAEAERVAERVQEAIAAPVLVDGRELHVSASIGIAVAGPGAEPGDVVRDADLAMYRAKSEGGARHALFDRTLHGRVLARLDLEAELRRSLEAGALALCYQPVVWLATGRVVGFEALLRWPEGHGAQAREVIAIAEESRLIVPLGRWVLEHACRQLAAWRATRDGAGLSMSVNVSALELADPGFVLHLREVLAATRVEPHALRLEIAERTLADHPARCRSLLAAVHELGVGAQVADFGAAASSLRCLHRFPGQAVKMDCALVAELEHDGDGAGEIAEAVVALAHALRLAVVAEGVETPRQRERLRALGCEYAQGFLFGGPQPAAAAFELVRRAAR
jgi:diguanylate cyclase (GGDEF)-like protein/PAS domain S-box-containing protein